MDIQLKEEIGRNIEEVGKLFKRMPDIFLTEGDMQFQICSKLEKIEELTTPSDASKGGKTIKLHLFIPFFDEERKKLSLRPDIVIINPASTDLTKGPTIHYSTKNYSVQNAEFLIELKLNKINGKKLMNKKIEKDIEKLKILSERNLCKSMIVLFDKKGLFNNKEINQFKSEWADFLYFKP